ncbi:nitroreductase family protein [Kribbella sp. NPDC004536]|uniref:nitroreductase family protein n=1 Tax=Kribbella sp. NPDC004536 TaxID=3364106 RepID=UPI0036CD4F0D
MSLRCFGGAGRFREFADRPIAPEVVERILASGQRGPSAGFIQGFAFLVLTDPDDRKRFWPFAPNQTRHKPRVMNAPLVIVPLAGRATYLERRPESRWPAPYWQIDTGMAAMLMLLAAVDEGLDGFLFWLMPDAETDFPDSQIPVHIQRFRDEFGVPRRLRPHRCHRRRPSGCRPAPAATARHSRTPRIRDVRSPWTLVVQRCSWFCQSVGTLPPGTDWVSGREAGGARSGPS